MSEIWKTIPDYPGYEASNLGNIRSVLRPGKEPRMLHPHDDNRGYLILGIMKDGKKVYQKAHRLIARTFLPDYSSTLQVNHINGVKTDNRVCNLEMVTGLQNIRHYLTQLKKPTTRVRKEVAYFDKDTQKELGRFKTVIDASRTLGISEDGIYRACKGIDKSSGGYIWKYCE